MRYQFSDDLALGVGEHARSPSTQGGGRTRPMLACSSRLRHESNWGNFPCPGISYATKTRTSETIIINCPNP